MSSSQVHIVDHPFVIDSLTHLRGKNTELQKFRHHSDKVCQLLFAEAIRGLEFKAVEVETPLAKMTAHKLADEIIVVPILRAGLAMYYGAMTLLPKSKFGFVGLERDEKTAVAHEYYWKLPQVSHNSVVIVTDPMLATGGSALHVLQRIAKLQPKALRLVSVLAAPEGVAAVTHALPQVEIYTAAIDSHLNDKKYIVPGLGDYGDRYFGTT